MLERDIISPRIAGPAVRDAKYPLYIPDMGVLS